MPRAELVSSLMIAFVAAMLPPSIPIMNPVFPLSGPASNSTWTGRRKAETQGRRKAGGRVGNEKHNQTKDVGCWNREI